MVDLFRTGVTMKKKEGTQICVESQPFRLTRLISEKFHPVVQERVAVFEGQRLLGEEVLDEEAVVLKLRLQCVHLFRSSYLISFTKIAFKGWIHTCLCRAIDR